MNFRTVYIRTWIFKRIKLSIKKIEICRSHKIVDTRIINTGNDMPRMDCHKGIHSIQIPPSTTESSLYLGYFWPTVHGDYHVAKYALRPKHESFQKKVCMLNLMALFAQFLIFLEFVGLFKVFLFLQGCQGVLYNRAWYYFKSKAK